VDQGPRAHPGAGMMSAVMVSGGSAQAPSRTGARWTSFESSLKEYIRKGLEPHCIFEYAYLQSEAFQLWSVLLRNEMEGQVTNLLFAEGARAVDRCPPQSPMLPAPALRKSFLPTPSRPRASSPCSLAQGKASIPDMLARTPLALSFRQNCVCVQVAGGGGA